MRGVSLQPGSETLTALSKANTARDQKAVGDEGVVVCFCTWISLRNQTGQLSNSSCVILFSGARQPWPHHHPPRGTEPNITSCFSTTHPGHPPGAPNQHMPAPVVVFQHGLGMGALSWSVGGGGTRMVCGATLSIPSRSSLWFRVIISDDDQHIVTNTL